MTDIDNQTIRRVAAEGEVSTVARLTATTGTADGTGTAARFNKPAGIAVDGQGNLWVTDSVNGTIRGIIPTGHVSTVAGTAGAKGSADGLGFDARFNDPLSIAADSEGNLHIADPGNNTIRRAVLGSGNRVLALDGTSG